MVSKVYKFKRFEMQGFDIKVIRTVWSVSAVLDNNYKATSIFIYNLTTVW